MALDPGTKRLATAMSERGALKLWSVIVTLLGDMAEGGQSEIPGPLLTAVVEEMGLQSQAMRVAIHRLRKDGWIESRKAARVGYYGLSSKGLAETRAVSPLVYGPLPAVQPCIAIAPAGLDLAGGVQLARQTWILDAREAPRDAVVSEVPNALPDWVRQQLAEASLEQSFLELEKLLSEIKTLPETPLRQLTLRVLVLHGWRRLILKSAPLCEVLLGPECAVARCRMRVGELLESLPLPSPAQVLEKVH